MILSKIYKVFLVKKLTQHRTIDSYYWYFCYKIFKTCSVPSCHDVPGRTSDHGEERSKHGGSSATHRLTTLKPGSSRPRQRRRLHTVGVRGHAETGQGSRSLGKVKV